MNWYEEMKDVEVGEKKKVERKIRKEEVHRRGGMVNKTERMKG